MTTLPTTLSLDPPPRLNLVSPRRRVGVDGIVLNLTRLGAITVLLMLAALVIVLVNAAAPTFKTFGLSFITGSEWRPNEREVDRRTPDGKLIFDADGEKLTDTLPPIFGSAPVIYGTAVTSVLALIVAVPMSFGASLFLVRIAPRWMTKPVSFLVEFLAAIPSIAYGIWGLVILSPFLRDYIEPPLNAVFKAVPGLRALSTDAGLTGRDMLCGGVILGIMIIPIITAISRDVLAQVPKTQVEGSIALGANWWQSCREMLWFSRSALFGAVMLGLARAAGETMAVTMVIGGSQDRINASLFKPAQTMSSLLVNQWPEAADLQRSALMAVALVLLVMSLTFNVIARYFVVGKATRNAT